MVLLVKQQKGPEAENESDHSPVLVQPLASSDPAWVLSDLTFSCYQKKVLKAALLQKVRKKDLHPKCPDHPLAPKRVEHFLETGTWFLATLLHPQKVAKMEQLLLQT